MFRGDIGRLRQFYLLLGQSRLQRLFLRLQPLLLRLQPLLPRLVL